MHNTNARRWRSICHQNGSQRCCSNVGGEKGGIFHSSINLLLCAAHCWSIVRAACECCCVRACCASALWTPRSNHWQLLDSAAGPTHNVFPYAHRKRPEGVITRGGVSTFAGMCARFCVCRGAGYGNTQVKSHCDHVDVEAIFSDVPTCRKVQRHYATAEASSKEATGPLVRTPHVVVEINTSLLLVRTYVHERILHTTVSRVACFACTFIGFCELI